MRLERGFGEYLNNLYADFNSIKVRLERFIVLTAYHSLTLFQFHTGAIRTGHRDISPDKNHKFQFHKGAIRHENMPCYIFIYFNFNSIKVRLEQIGSLVQ